MQYQTNSRAANRL